MRSRRVFLFAVVAWLLFVAVGAAQAERPMAVSPGSPTTFVRVEGRCPTFIWGAVRDTLGYELVVYGLGRTDGTGDTGPIVLERPVLRRLIPGSALGWTPSLEGCLEPGERYAWAVRAQREGSDSGWSEASLFAVSPVPSAAEVQAALALLQGYVAAGGSLEAPGETRAAGDFRPGGPAEEGEPPPAGVSAPPLAGEALSFSGTTAIRGHQTDPTGETYGVLGISHSSDDASSGLVGQSTAASGETRGVVGQVASGDGVAGLFENTAGGRILVGQDDGTEVFSVEGDGQVLASGDVTAPGFVGDGSMLGNVTGSDLDCVDCVTSPEIVDGTVTAADIADGAGSGLDADLLDGNEADAFMPAGTDLWVNVSGDTMTGNLRIDGNLGIQADPLTGTNSNIYLYDSGIYSDPRIHISGHNSGALKLERRRSDGHVYFLESGCGADVCPTDFVIRHQVAGRCIGIRDGCDVDIPKLEVDTFKLNPTDSPGTCEGATEGRMYYDDSLAEPCYCNGADWTQFDGGGAC